MILRRFEGIEFGELGVGSVWERRVVVDGGVTPSDTTVPPEATLVMTLVRQMPPAGVDRSHTRSMRRRDNLQRGKRRVQRLRSNRLVPQR